MAIKHSGVLCVASCYMLIGVSYPVAKQAMESIPTWTFTCLTFLIGLFVLLPFSLRVDKTDWLKIHAKDWLAISVQALFGAVLYTVFLLYGLPETSAVAASVITSVAPAFVLVLSVLFLKENIKFKSVISVALAVASVIMMTTQSLSANSGHSSLSGLLFLALSTLSNSAVIIFAQKFTSQLKPMTMATGVCLIGTVLSFPLALVEDGGFSLRSFNQNQLLTLAYYGIMVWAVPYVLFFNGIWKVKASTAGMTVALVPVASMLAAAVFFGEKITQIDIIATLLIVLSIVIAEIKFSINTSKELA